MPISYKIQDVQTRTIDFLKIMISNGGVIVLFTSPKIGTVLNRCTFNSGYYSTDWFMKNFNDFDKQIILENE